MLVVMERNTPERVIQEVVTRLSEKGFEVHRSTGVTKTVLGIIGDTSDLNPDWLQMMPGVQKVHRISEPFKLASRSFHPDSSVIKIGDLEIGGDKIVVMAGPCSVEGRESITEIAKQVRKAGALILRGGAFKPRTSPYEFQGLGEEGLKYLKEAAEMEGLLSISEVMEINQIPLLLEYVDILQVGARNMQNYSLLKELGRIDKPVLLKRGMAATIEEWLMAAEYIISRGNFKVILCERGIRTFEKYTRNTLDISSIPIVQKLSHLPVIADPSHGTGVRENVIPMAKASIAAGAHGLLLEVHSDPPSALSDGFQSLYPHQFEKLMKKLDIIARAVDKTL
ncbi:MAG: 3-deoxy-7-phosphoheptulonate synthase [Fidelibacterota bacterium]